MKVPFQLEIKDLFASDQSIALKLLAGAFVGGFVSLEAVLKDTEGISTSPPSYWKVMIVVVTTVMGALVVLLLSFRDVVVRRVEEGNPVNPLLRAYFGRGNGCLMVALWFVTVIVATLVVTMLTVNL